MLKHYLKYTIRNFKSKKLIFAGSVATVFLSALCITLLYTYLRNEKTMDGFHKHADDIYMFTVQQSPETNPRMLDPKRFFNFNYQEYPEIEAATSIVKFPEGEMLIKYGDVTYSPEGIVAGSAFFEMFDFSLKTGNEEDILQDMDAAILSEEFAKKVFGENDPIGKVIEADNRVQKNYVIKGIVESPPSNSSLTFDFILPENSANFSRIGAYFIAANKHFNEADFIKKIEDIGSFHPQFKNSKTNIVGLKTIFYNDNISELNSFFTRHGNKKTIYILYIIIVVIFLISILNSSNLQIVNINASLKNIGIQKTTGAEKKHIFYQKFFEIFLIIILSAILVTPAYIIILPVFNNLTGAELTSGIIQIFVTSAIVAALLMAFAIIYPSTIIYTISAKKNLKSQLLSKSRLAGRNVITTVQFSLSLILLIASVIVTRQLNLMLNKDLGFDSENIMYTQIFHEPDYNGNMEEYNKELDKLNEEYQYVVNELRINSIIENFSQGFSPIEPYTSEWKSNNSNSDYVSVNNIQVTPSYLDLLGLKITDGRFFEKDRESDKAKVVINEAAKRFFGINDITNDRLKTPTWRPTETDGVEIIGVVQDFNYEHLSASPKPLIMIYSTGDMTANFLIQFHDNSTQAGIQFVQQLFKNVNPKETFNYTFLSDEIQALYQKEKILSKVYSLFTFVAFIISAIGLFTTSLYETKTRIKEIGIRKVNGAKVSEILAMLNKDFVKWVVIAFVIATPIAYYAMNKWLANFAYKTTLSWWIFALAGFLALGIALLTVSWQSWRAATRNPVEALRYE